MSSIKNIKILLCTPSFNSENIRRGESLGIRYIASHIINQGFNDVDILDPSLEDMSILSFISFLDRKKYNLIGISIPYDGLAYNAISTIQEIKKTNPNVHICVGGHFPTFNYEEILNKVKEVDSVAIGYSEETFCNLATALIEDYPISSIANLYTRDSIDFKINHNSPAILINELPFPMRNMPGEWNYGGHYSIISSRGCPYHCSFCSAPSFSNGNIWVARNPDSVVSEIQLLSEKYAAKTVSFLDSCFLGYNKDGRYRSMEIAHKINKTNPDLSWSFECRVSNISKELFYELRILGLKHVFLGIESFIPRKLKLFRKQTNPIQNESAIQILDELGITFYFGFIMFDPYILKAEILSETNILAELGILTYKSLTSKLIPYKGTKLYDTLEKESLLIRDGWQYKIKFQNSAISVILKNLTYIFEPMKLFDKELYETQYLFQCMPQQNNLSMLRAIAKEYSNEFVHYVKEVVETSEFLLDNQSEELRVLISSLVAKYLKKLESVKVSVSSLNK